MDFHGIAIPDDRLAESCRKWKVKELSLFGSIVREDFRPESDVDILVVFAPDATWSLWDLFGMRDELQQLFGREIDLVVRFGGEEFVVILPEAKVRDAVEVAERIRNRVVAADFFHAEDLPPSHITISLGVASYGEGVSNEEELIAMADQAMYAAKRFGRNRVEVYPA